ncbi:type IV conjugative transfer system protein TraL [Thiotrichales bacterium 19S9-12]|nr:type IV conjugative transfer system protein TraL [Thiotrichales bacterium 19S9-11]MCF6812535.1 type IV conjugative transfer system protein TraL [Thiotrichales bacterium 19S9-12]
MQREYHTFMLSDEPKLFGIPIVTGLPCIGLTVIGLLTGLGISLFLFGAVISLIFHLKFGGEGIRFFYSFIYWMLPNQITKLILRKSPNSANRVYLR